MLINLNTYGSKTPPLLQICWIGVSFVSLKVLEHKVENCMMHEREQKINPIESGNLISREHSVFTSHASMFRQGLFRVNIFFFLSRLTNILTPFGRFLPCSKSNSCTKILEHIFCRLLQCFHLRYSSVTRTR